MEPLLLPPHATPSQIPQAHDPRSKLFDSLQLQIAMLIQTRQCPIITREDGSWSRGMIVRK